MCWRASFMIASVQAPMKVLHVVSAADVAELDPTQAANQIGRICAQMVFDSLFALERTLSPKPMMVENEQVSRRDVVASLQQWMDGSSVGGQLKSRLASVNIVDDQTLVLTLNKPFGLIEYILAGPGAPIAGIMREVDAKRPDNMPLTDPIGSGPFRYVAGD